MGNLEYAPSKVLIYARIGDDWSLSEAILDEGEGSIFDPSDLPDSFSVLQIDRMVRRLIIRAWPNGLNFDGADLLADESSEHTD